MTAGGTKKDEPFERTTEVRQSINVGILKNKDKADLEDAIAGTLKNLNTRLTKREVLSLINRIEVSSGLDGLRKELEKEKKLENTDISDEVLRMIFDLFHEVEQVAETGLQELKLEISKLNESKNYQVDKRVYLTNRIPWIKKLEESELGKNIIIDIAGMTVGALDSVHAILSFLLTLLKDFALLPKHVMEHVRHNSHHRGTRSKKMVHEDTFSFDDEKNA